MTKAELFLLQSQWEQIIPKRLQGKKVQQGYEIPALKINSVKRPYKNYTEYLELTSRLQTAMLAQIANQIKEEEQAQRARATRKAQKRVQNENRQALVKRANFFLFFGFTAILAVVFTFLNYHNVLWLIGGERFNWLLKAPFVLFAGVIAFSPYFFALNKERGKLSFVGIAYGIEMLIYIVNLHWPLAKDHTWYIVGYALYYATYVYLLSVSLYRTFTKKNSFEKV